MPQNGCVLRCKSNAARNPELCYHELPSRENFWDAWLKNISRQGSEKSSQWPPSSRSVVCSLHFKEEGYKLGMKRKLLRPTAVPTRFPLYPFCMQPARSKKRRTLVRVTPNASTSPASGKSQQRKMQSPAERRPVVKIATICRNFRKFKVIS